MEDRLTTFLRYPGSKRRMLDFLSPRLPTRSEIKGRFIEPFVGGGAVFFSVRPKNAVLGDLNSELIDLYRGIRINPERVWRIYRAFPGTKENYWKVRDKNVLELSLVQRAARSLYLNRTCFKGMWRHNRKGKFNIGYGGQDRRWAITRGDLFTIAELLKKASLRCGDFQHILEQATVDDFLFLDPPYRPGEREQAHAHYSAHQFAFQDHIRLADAVKAADRRGVRWSMTISAHPDILGLYRRFHVRAIPSGTGRSIGALASEAGEVLISNMR